MGAALVLVLAACTEESRCRLRIVTHVQGSGIASLLDATPLLSRLSPTTGEPRVDFLAGTRNGRFQGIQVLGEGTIRVHNLLTVSDETSEISSSTSPVFSLAGFVLASSSAYILAGGGDRYVTVHKFDKSFKNEIFLPRLQKLGPHTGWVKDLTVIKQDNAHVLYSIGCNHIESWIYSETSAPNIFESIGKLSVESSVNGCTLSADLLCLTSDENVLLSGGVDGRIHCWTPHYTLTASSESDKMKKARMKYFQSDWLAHNGRINQLVVQDGRLYSCSHDGMIKCWIKTHQPIPEVEEVTYGRMYQLVGSISVGLHERVTAIVPVPQETCLYNVYIYFATHRGVVGMIRIDTTNDSMSILDTIHLPNEPMIHALCVKNLTLVAGHALGVTSLQFAR